VKLNLILALLYLLCTCAAYGQTASPLLVGSVRDQLGLPIASARVVARTSAGRVVAQVFTSVDGTFSAATDAAAHVHIECTYCRPTDVSVVPDQAVVAIVHRYTALTHDVPSADDVRALPYANAESALSLAAYVVLADSTRIVPGPVLSDRGLSRAGGLVIDRGVPDYDIAADISPFLTIPMRFATSLDSRSAAEAFRYGDRADAGTFSLAPDAEGSGALFAGGYDRIATVHGAAGFLQGDAAFTGNVFSERSTVDVTGRQLIPDGSMSESVAFARGDLHPGRNRIASSFNSARVAAQRTRANRRYAELVADHGTYGITQAPFFVDSQWSDVQLRAGVQSIAPNPGFLELSVRRPKGDYNALPRVPEIAAGIDQTQLTGGIHFSSATSDVNVALAGFAVSYSGGPLDPEYAPSAQGAGTSLLAPTVQYRYHPDPHWFSDVVIAGTFRLPTLLERYARPPVAPVLTLDRNALAQVTVGYSDLARMHASVTVFHQSTSGLDVGSVAGIGAALAWQVAPQVSLRSWVLHETDTTRAVVPLVRFTPAGISATVGSAWLTYEANGWRADAIYRRDILDASAYGHFDFAVSGKLAARSRWFFSSEVRHRERAIDFGLELLAPP